MFLLLTALSLFPNLIMLVQVKANGVSVSANTGIYKKIIRDDNMDIIKILGLGVLKYIGIVILVVVIVIPTLFVYFSLQMYLFGKGDYLLFVSNNLNIIPAFMIMLLLLYFIITAYNKLIAKKYDNEWTDDETQNDDSLENIEALGKKEQILLKLINKLLELLDIFDKLFKIVKLCYIPVLLAAVYVGMTSYTILYPNSIKLSSPLQPTGITYDYKDVEIINVGIDKGNDDSYDPYYEVVLTDGTSIDFFGGSSMSESDKGFEEVLFDFDKKIRDMGVDKNVNKKDFEKYAEGLNTEFVRRVEKLFIK